MAIANIEYLSQALQRTVSFYLILPNDVMGHYKENNLHYERPMKTLMLLHGYFGSSSEWLYKSEISELAARYNLCVILPSGENSFYTDGSASGRQYAKFIGEELLNYVQDTFNLSKKAEDNFIGGFSMGGFGALLTALQYNKTYSKTFALSAALITESIDKMEESHQAMANYDYYRLVFGDLKQVKQSRNHPLFMIEQIREAEGKMPDLFIACGSEDWLIEGSRNLVKALGEMSVPVEYIEKKGGHDFGFWNQVIEPAIKWCLDQKS